jgi:putative flippase GtrA
MMHLAKYFFVGSIAAGVDIALFTFCAGYLGWPWIPVSICTFILATLLNYFLSIKYVFESGVRHKKHLEITGVYVVSIFGLAVNQLILYIIITWVHWSLFIAKICATTVVFFWNYFSRKRFIF